jgi:hypothetical protein
MEMESSDVEISSLQMVIQSVGGVNESPRKEDSGKRRAYIIPALVG